MDTLLPGAGQGGLEDARGMTEVELQIERNRAGQSLPFLWVTLDGRDERLLLDTGAAQSCLAENENTLRFPSMGSSASIGASGIPARAELVQPQSLTLGGRTFANPLFRRMASGGVLGLDVLAQLVFEVDLAGRRLALHQRFPQGERALRLTRLRRGHLTVEIELEGSRAAALFDTGANATLVDQAYVQRHQKVFDYLRKEPGFDGNGHLVDSRVYLCHELRLGTARFTNVEMVSFPFSHRFRDHVEGAPVLLGTNVIEQRRWVLDPRALRWCAMAKSPGPSTAAEL